MIFTNPITLPHHKPYFIVNLIKDSDVYGVYLNIKSLEISGYIDYGLDQITGQHKSVTAESLRERVETILTIMKTAVVFIDDENEKKNYELANVFKGRFCTSDTSKQWLDESIMYAEGADLDSVKIVRDNKNNVVWKEIEKQLEEISGKIPFTVQEMFKSILRGLECLMVAKGIKDLMLNIDYCTDFMEKCLDGMLRPLTYSIGDFKDLHVFQVSPEDVDKFSDIYEHILYLQQIQYKVYAGLLRHVDPVNHHAIDDVGLVIEADKINKYITTISEVLSSGIKIKVFSNTSELFDRNINANHEVLPLAEIAKIIPDDGTNFDGNYKKELTELYKQAIFTEIQKGLMHDIKPVVRPVEVEENAKSEEDLSITGQLYFTGLQLRSVPYVLDNKFKAALTVLGDRNSDASIFHSGLRQNGKTTFGAALIKYHNSIGYDVYYMASIKDKEKNIESILSEFTHSSGGVTSIKLNVRSAGVRKAFVVIDDAEAFSSWIPRLGYIKEKYTAFKCLILTNKTKPVSLLYELSSIFKHIEEFKNVNQLKSPETLFIETESEISHVVKDLLIGDIKEPAERKYTTLDINVYTYKLRRIADLIASRDGGYIPNDLFVEEFREGYLTTDNSDIIRKITENFWYFTEVIRELSMAGIYELDPTPQMYFAVKEICNGNNFIYNELKLADNYTFVLHLKVWLELYKSATVDLTGFSKSTSMQSCISTLISYLNDAGLVPAKGDDFFKGVRICIKDKYDDITSKDSINLYIVESITGADLVLGGTSLIKELPVFTDLLGEEYFKPMPKRIIPTGIIKTSDPDYNSFEFINDADDEFESWKSYDRKCTIIPQDQLFNRTIDVAKALGVDISAIDSLVNECDRTVLTKAIDSAESICIDELVSNIYYYMRYCTKIALVEVEDVINMVAIVEHLEKGDNLTISTCYGNMQVNFDILGHYLFWKGLVTKKLKISINGDNFVPLFRKYFNHIDLPQWLYDRALITETSVFFPDSGSLIDIAYTMDEDDIILLEDIDKVGNPSIIAKVTGCNEPCELKGVPCS